MKRRLINRRFATKICTAMFLICGAVFGVIFAQTHAVKINDGNQVPENTELTYYLTATADGIDSAKINSENGQVASVHAGVLSIEDKLPRNLTFIGFETTEDGHFGAVSQSDHSVVCDGRVIDDTPDDSIDQTTQDDNNGEYHYHGLHYQVSTHSVHYQVQNLQAGCELTIGIRVKTPTLPNANSRYDFYNTGRLTDGDRTNLSNTVYFWMGRQEVATHKVSYIYEGDVPADAPALESEQSYAPQAYVWVAPKPEVKGYTFSGWRIASGNVTYLDNNGNYLIMGNTDVVLAGSFTPSAQPAQYPVIYEIEGEAPLGYTAPATQSYEVGDTVQIDSMSAGQKIGAYTFSGWQSDDVDTSEESFQMPNQERVLIRGDFERKKYTLDYAFAGSETPDNATSLLPPSEEHEAGDIIEVADNPSAEGWRFLGWSESSDFEMPESDYTIVGTWERIGETFVPEISKRIVNPQEVYHKDDIVEFEVTVKNTADYPIRNVVLREENEETVFCESEDYTILSDQIIEIPQILANDKINVCLKHKVQRNETATITDVTLLASAIADGAKALDLTKNYRAESIFRTEAIGTPDETESESEPYAYNPNTGDNIVVAVVFAVLLVASAATVLLANPRRRLASRAKPFALVLGVFATAGLACSIATNSSFADWVAKKESVTSQFAQYPDQDSWRLEKKVGWISSDTVRISLDFSSIRATDTKPIDLIFAISNDRTVSRDDFARYREEVMRFASSFLDGTNNRIGIISNETDFNYYESATVKQAPTNDLNAIDAAFDRILTHDFYDSAYYSAPLEAAKLIASADDGIDRQPIVIAIGDTLFESVHTYDSLAQSKQILPNLIYVIRTDVKPITFVSNMSDYAYGGGNHSISDLIRIDHRFEFQLKDVIGDDFEITRTIGWKACNNSREELSCDFNTEQEQFDVDGNTISVSMSGHMGVYIPITIEARLKNPNSQEHQEYTPNQTLTFDIETRDGNQILATEHHELSGKPTIMNGFRLEYDANAPEGCEVTGLPETTIHNAATIAQVSTAKPSCDGYRFAGFSVSGGDVEYLGQSSFIMPARDVVVRGSWIKTGLKKSMEGEVVQGTATYFADGVTVYNAISRLGKSNIESIVTADSVPSGIDSNRIVDLSDTANNAPLAIYAWLSDDEKTLYVHTDATRAYLNSNSSRMFEGLSNLKNISALADFDASFVTNLSNAFASDRQLADMSPIANWNVSRVTDISNIFSDDDSITNLDAVSGWRMPYLKNAYGAFGYMEALVDISGIANWDVSRLEDASSMFSHDTSLSDISPLANWRDKVTKLKKTNNMFNAVPITTLSALANWNLPMLEEAEAMFYASDLINIDALGTWTIPKLWNLKNMFNGQGNIASYSALANWAQYSSTFRDFENTFRDNTKLTSLEPFANWSVSAATNLKYTFSGAKITSLQPIQGWRVKSAASLSGLFQYGDFANLSGIEHLLDNATSQAIDITHTFSHNDKLENIDALDSWKNKASQIKRMEYTFGSDPKLASISGLQNWTNVNLNEIRGIFSNDTMLTDISAISNFGVGNISTFDSAFAYTAIRSLEPLRNWDMSKAIYISNMFSGCAQVESLSGLESWNVSKVTTMRNTFSGMTSLRNVNALSGWQTNSLLTIDSLFANDAQVTDFSALNGWYFQKINSKNGAFDGTNGTLPTWWSII